MDRISQIEEGLKEVLMGINGTTVGAYEYVNTLKSVYFEQDDEALSVTNLSRGYPVIVVKMEPDETILSGESQAYQNVLNYVLEGKVENNTPTTNPKQAIKTKMNELAQDVKCAISNNYHLNGTCDEAELMRVVRRYRNDGNALRSGDVLMYLKVTYTQARLNPAINVCK